MRMQPMVIGHHYMASAGQYLATEAAHAILRAGGNAIDAGVAGGIALGVVHSDQVQFSGVAPMLIYLADRNETVSIAGLGWWPKALNIEQFIRDHNGTIPVGLQRTVVPAAPDAWILALQRYGTMSFGEVAASAIRYARDGFAVHTVMATFLQDKAEDYRRWPQNTAIWQRDGKPLARRRPAGAGRSRPHDPVHGRPGKGGGGQGPRCRPDGGARRLLSRRHCPDDREVSPRERRAADARGSRRVPLRDRGAAALHLQGHRRAELRSVVPGAGAAADAVAAGRGRPRGAGPQFEGLRPSPGRGHEPLLCRPRALLRRSALRRRSHGDVAVARLCAGAAEDDPQRSRLRRDAAGRCCRWSCRGPHQKAVGGRRRAGTAGRHLLCLRGRFAGQRLFGDAERRVVGKPGHSRSRALPVVARLAVVGRSQPHLGRRTRQAAAGSRPIRRWPCARASS